MILNRVLRSPLLTLSALSLLVGACSKSNKTEVWVYTSTFKEVLATYDEALKKDLPDIQVKWFQSGSENVAAKILAEQGGGGTKADILLTSDLFFYQEMKKTQKLKAFSDDLLKGVPPEMVDPDKAFVVTRFPVMLIAYNKQNVKEADIPKSFKSLLDPKYKGKLTMASPLESGTAMTSILFLKRMFGEAYFKGLRKNEVLSSGGNGAVFSRIQSGEKPIGILLMENVLQAKEKGNDYVEFIIPEEGGIPIPSPIAMFANTKHPEQTQKLIQWFLSPMAQEKIVKGWVYSMYPDAKPPVGAPAWSQLKLQSWDLKTFELWGSEKQAVKDSFQNIVLK